MQYYCGGFLFLPHAFEGSPLSNPCRALQLDSASDPDLLQVQVMCRYLSEDLGYFEVMGGKVRLSVSNWTSRLTLIQKPAFGTDVDLDFNLGFLDHCQNEFPVALFADRRVDGMPIASPGWVTLRSPPVKHWFELQPDARPGPARVSQHQQKTTAAIATRKIMAR